ncbi:MAG: hypothetical protein FJ290_33455 [Planctomycetes bacterium]|nr:hypothetical protein [Planctomycetota bacterium]
MARPLRIELPEAIYHVTGRGNARAAIVADEGDRDKWLALLAKTVERQHWRVFAFALLDNHFHLFLQTPEPNLSVGMHDLCGTYAGYFNRRHERSGHVFQGRFKAVLVEGQGHWLEVSRYVHLNPVRAGLVRRPEDWRWSSYRGYHLASRCLPWVACEQVLEEFGRDLSAARRAYRAFMEEGLGRKLDSPLARAVAGVVLGSEAFVTRVRALLAPRPDDGEVPPLARLRAVPRIEAIARAVAERFGSDAATWREGRRTDDLSRAVAAYLARKLTREPLRAIAAALGYRRASSVCVACQRVERALGSPRSRRDVASLIRELGAND